VRRAHISMSLLCGYNENFARSNGRTPLPRARGRAFRRLQEELCP
jgi:hypothetical protein